MSKINFEDIQEKYSTALTEKENNADEVIAAIADNDLIEKFKSIQKDKEKIESSEDLERYQKRLKSFFEEVYRIITAPGVNKFIEWLENLDKKGEKISGNISQILIDEYSEYDNQIKSILENKNVIDQGDSIFEAIKSSVRSNIVKRLQNFGNTKDEIKENLPDFIDELESLLSGLSEIKELKYDNVKNFYTNNIENTDNDDFIVEIDEETDFYFNLIKQIIEAKDFLTKDQQKIKIHDIVEKINNAISDINKSIEVIKSIGIWNESDENIKIFYNEFEKSLNFKIGQQDIADFIQQSINDTWEKLVTAYNTSQEFFSNYTLEKVKKLNGNKAKWSVFDFSSKIEQYILTIENIISDNPIETINSDDILKIKSAYTNIDKKIKSLEENNPKDDIVNYFSNITSEFKKKKIGILRKLNIEEYIIIKITDEISRIKTFVSNIEEAENLLDALNDDFVDGIIPSYNIISGEYRNAIKNSEIKDDLDFLDKIDEEGYVLSKEELEKKVEVLKRLLEYDLININLTKNI